MDCAKEDDMNPEAIASHNRHLKIKRMLRKARKGELIDDYADLLQLMLEQLEQYERRT